MEYSASAELKSINAKGYLFINNITSEIIKDKNLGLLTPVNSLNLTFFDSSKNTTITESINIDPKAIVYDMKVRGLKIALPASVNNALCVASNKYNGKFCVSVSEFNLNTKEAVSSPFYLDATVTEKLVQMIDTPELSKASFSNASTHNFSAEANKVTSDSTANTAASVATQISSAAAATPSNTKKKFPLVPVTIGAILLLLLLGALVAYLLGLFGNSAKDESPVSETNQTQQVADEQDDNSVANEKEPDAESSSDDTEVTQVEKESSAPSASANTQAQDNLSLCSIDNPDDIKVIKSCIAQKADTNTIVNLARQAFENDRCDLGKRLFSSFGRKDAQVALAYAKYFDRNQAVLSKCENKVDTQAIYWYEKAVSLGDLAEAKVALSEFKGKK